MATTKNTDTQRNKPAGTTGPKTTTSKSASTTKSAAGKSATPAKKVQSTTKPASTTTKQGGTTSKKNESVTDKAAKAATAAKKKADSKMTGNTGKIIAATAGVAAAAAAGVAYFRGTRGAGAGGATTVYHVQPGDDGWQVKGADADRASSRHSTKKEALSAARDLAHSKVPSQLVVHRSDGSVQESWSYDAES